MIFKKHTYALLEKGKVVKTGRFGSRSETHVSIEQEVENFYLLFPNEVQFGQSIEITATEILTEEQYMEFQKSLKPSKD